MDSDDQSLSGHSTGQQEDRDSEAYRQKRDRNNLAVKKSREKSRQKTTETAQRMTVLRVENEKLEQKVSDLTKELGIMKELLLAHARGNKVKEHDDPPAPSTSSSVRHTTPGTSRGRVPQLVVAASSSVNAHWPGQSMTPGRSAAARQKKQEVEVENLYTIPVHSDHEYFVAKCDDSVGSELSLNSTYNCDELNTPELYLESYDDE